MFVNMRSVAQEEMEGLQGPIARWLHVSTASTQSSTRWPSTVILIAFGSSAVKIRFIADPLSLKGRTRASNSERHSSSAYSLL
jgi:hypothetical protein